MRAQLKDPSFLARALKGRQQSVAYASRGPKITAATTGKKRGKKKIHSAETIAKISRGVVLAFQQGRLLPHAPWKGKRLTEEHRKNIGRGSKEVATSPQGRARLSAQAKGAILRGRHVGYKGAKTYEFLDRLGRLWRFRSTWERRVAEQLDEKQLTWLYEPVRLLLSDGRVYVPDFWVEEAKGYVEVKGWTKGPSADKSAIACKDGHVVFLITTPNLSALEGVWAI